MKAERWKQVESLFQSALDRSPQERDTFLRDACAGDEALEREVRSHLACAGSSGSFLQNPAIDTIPRAVVSGAEDAEVYHGIAWLCLCGRQSRKEATHGKPHDCQICKELHGFPPSRLAQNGIEKVHTNSEGRRPLLRRTTEDLPDKIVEQERGRRGELEAERIRFA